MSRARRRGFTAQKVILFRSAGQRQIIKSTHRMEKRRALFDQGIFLPFITLLLLFVNLHKCFLQTFLHRWPLRELLIRRETPRYFKFNFCPWEKIKFKKKIWKNCWLQEHVPRTPSMVREPLRLVYADTFYSSEGEGMSTRRCCLRDVYYRMCRNGDIWQCHIYRVGYIVVL